MASQISKVKELFDSSLNLESGKKLIVPGNSESHRESLRSSFYRERKNWRIAFPDDGDILISRFNYENEEKRKIFCVSLERVSESTVPFLILPDGKREEVKYIQLEEEEEKTKNLFYNPEVTAGVNQTLSEEDKRIKKLMLEEGKSEEEVEEFFNTSK
jgi:hypothetical protein